MSHYSWQLVLTLLSLSLTSCASVKAAPDTEMDGWWCDCSDDEGPSYVMEDAHGQLFLVKPILNEITVERLRHPGPI